MPKKHPYFSNLLISWYLEHKRELPWRSTQDPYRIWLSEIMLQQTRVDQGLPYYERFVEAFPTVFELANAPESKVLKLWQGLGYYSRARNLHHTARYIVKEFQGAFPDTYEALRALKGVGDYTASAIASICFERPTAVVDGNVYRVLARCFGIDSPINSSKGAKQFKELAQQLIDPLQPGTFNQAIMEFGARYCVPSNPDCAHCILGHRCVAYQKHQVGQLPVKLPKTNIKTHHFHFLVCLSEGGKTLLEQRKSKGIWQNLYQFPLLESESPITIEALKAMPSFKGLTGGWEVISMTQYNDTPIIHRLSHKHLHTTFWILETKTLPQHAIPFHEVRQYPVPILLWNFISGFGPFQP
ncbi:MAG TPA: A/G-specific adenine glycosylase [Flavobacteriaceae bacterium]|nr:A/G-specific adenine glycosylase [Flavobacteriaceae bacterium]MCB9212638.1 A/G-specific adenine glycosylase [Alteromonas sp.]HPF11501.1 A/G-specific adenine glycosylase [Flavobacteriaceae bacterium]HQU21034.1 A/G-specific adenine glycosylase [Flavobacteriaceae bacterium]HQU65935.1 A/G-specific adenine glycosylase [Flavobacteriaceae bacterium]